jgi:hypothetical protein
MSEIWHSIRSAPDRHVLRGSARGTTSSGLLAVECDPQIITLPGAAASLTPASDPAITRPAAEPESWPELAALPRGQTVVSARLDETAAMAPRPLGHRRLSSTEAEGYPVTGRRTPKTTQIPNLMALIMAWCDLGTFSMPGSDFLQSQFPPYPRNDSGRTARLVLSCTQLPYGGIR